MTDSNSQKPAGFTAGNPPYAGQQPGTPPPFDERAQAASRTVEHSAGELAGQARTTASQMADQAKSMVRTRVSERASKSAIEVADFARALRQTGRQLEGNVASPLISRAAEQLDRVSELLDSNDPDEFVQNVERFARQQPLLFLGGAFALGIAGARFLKSSATHARPESAAGEVGLIAKDFRP